MSMCNVKQYTGCPETRDSTHVEADADAVMRRPNFATVNFVAVLFDLFRQFAYDLWQPWERAFRAAHFEYVAIA